MKKMKIVQHNSIDKHIDAPKRIENINNNKNQIKEATHSNGFSVAVVLLWNWLLAHVFHHRTPYHRSLLCLDITIFIFFLFLVSLDRLNENRAQFFFVFIVFIACTMHAIVFGTISTFQGARKKKKKKKTKTSRVLCVSLLL